MSLDEERWADRTSNMHGRRIYEILYACSVLIYISGCILKCLHVVKTSRSAR
jgi:hypothetical protein